MSIYITLHLRVRVFLSPEHFILFQSEGLSKGSYLVPYLWFLCVFCYYCRCCLAMDEAFCDVQKEILPSSVLKVISLTGVCSSLVVAAPCFVGVDVVAGSQSNSISVSAKAKCEHYIGEVDCCEYRAMVVLAL